MERYEIEWDGDGYPTEESMVAFSVEPEIADIPGVIARLPEIMTGCPYAAVRSKEVDGELEVEFHTRGWSGAETVIDAILDWQLASMMYHTKWERGGHYWFRVPLESNNPAV